MTSEPKPVGRGGRQPPHEKNCTLIRNDIVIGVRNLHKATGDETIEQRAMALIVTEGDLKYRRKYAKSWRQ
ncbi:hypothetical protein [Nonomuraea sp. LPB2021202275-12-8]|uniref:hypothetical protein n=1 Tax=Nonomuraea sp. LPB2021202275-12-8 TaxID=3120159 RepID=UPI00300CEC1C